LKVATEYDWTSSVSTEAILNIQSDQRSAANTDLQIPGFGVLDLNWRYRADSYSVVFQVQNVLDKQYYRTQFGPNGIYPEIGRAFFVNLNAEF
jgi:iron complex outermembrane recepter protein